MKRVLKFYSEGCGPCKLMSKRLESLKGAEVQDVDIADEDNESLMDEWKIRTVPTVIVLGEKNEFLGEFKGVTSVEKIQEAIDGKA
jgi:Thioredoxin.